MSYMNAFSSIIVSQVRFWDFLILYPCIVLPSFVTKPRNQTANENERVTFYCNASGNPTPIITWLKDGTTVGTGNTLRFDSTWRYQSGRYWCEAQNGLNVTIRTSADLNVQCEYKHVRELKEKSTRFCLKKHTSWCAFALMPRLCQLVFAQMYFRQCHFTYCLNRYDRKREDFNTLTSVVGTFENVTPIVSVFTTKPHWRQLTYWCGRGIKFWKPSSSL